MKRWSINLKALKTLIAISAVFYALSASASGSFRLSDGKLIAAGKSKSEVIAIAGAPVHQEVETIAVDVGQDRKPVKREILTYRLEGSIGGMYLVEVTLENGKVVSVTSKQEDRL